MYTYLENRVFYKQNIYKLCHVGTLNIHFVYLECEL